MTVRDQPRMTLSRPQRTCWTGRTWVRPQRRGAGGQLPVRPSWSGVQDGRRRRHAVLVPVCWPRATPKRGAADGSIRRTGANEILRKYDVWGGIRNTQELPAPGAPALRGQLGHRRRTPRPHLHRARYYDPVLGSSSARIAEGWGGMVCLCGNNPVVGGDPMGVSLSSTCSLAPTKRQSKLRELLSARGPALVNTNSQNIGAGPTLEVALGRKQRSALVRHDEIVGSTIHGRGDRILLHAAGILQVGGPHISLFSISRNRGEGVS